jgi:anhydro-N-acetylmuramic acid kinase
VEHYVGLMSGTSMDGVDAAVCRFEGAEFRGVVAHARNAYPTALRQRLLRLQRELPPLTLAEYAELDQLVAAAFAGAALAAIKASGLPADSLRAIGSHGQTVFHDPDGFRTSLQLGNPSWIAAVTGLDTVADFRRADIAIGGHGAPLVPAFHHAVFAGERCRAIVNIGGIANVTLLPGPDPAHVLGSDTGPGNGLMDEWSEQHLDCDFDHNGEFAAGGRLQLPLLQVLQADPYFAKPPPKSTGRDYFRLKWVLARYPELAGLPPADVQRTFCELTAYSIAEALSRSGAEPEEVLVCGGGVKNGTLMRRLAELLAPVAVHSTERAGLDPLWVEAAAFAWLAMRRMHDLPGNLPAVTGARGAAVLGGIYRGRR